MSETMEFNMSSDKNAALADEFTYDPSAAMKEMETNLGPVKEMMTHPDLSELVKESKIPEMLEHDIGEGLKLGNSKIVRSALADAARKIEYRREQLYGNTRLNVQSLVTREQELSFRRESLAIIRAALMDARAKFIAKTGQPLKGWM